MIIEKAEINEDYWQNTYCEYQLIEDGKIQTYRTENQKGLVKNPVFKYE